MDNSDKVKVLHVLTRADVGGICSLLHNYYSSMAKGNVVFHVVAIETTYRQSYQKIFENLGILVFFMPEHRFRRLLFLNKLIREVKYHAVHTHVELVSAIYLVIAMASGIKVRIAHTHLAVDNKGFKNKALQMLLNVVVTHRLGCSKSAIAKLFGVKYVDHATVIPNAIDPSRYIFDPLVRELTRRALQIEGKYVVGFIGRFTALKNIPYVLDVFKALKEKKENAVLLLVGDGEERGRISLRVKELGIMEQVKFLGNRTDINHLLMAMDVLLFPSFSEGLGLVMIEAQSAALKCIASLDRVPKETSISSYIHYEAIEKPATIWSDLILEKCIHYERANMEHAVGRCHFDVRIEASNLIDFYNKAVKIK